MLESTKNPQINSCESFKIGECIYFFRRGPKLGTSDQAVITGIRDHFLVLSQGRNRRGKPSRAAYEDVWKFPISSLLQELDRYEFSFPRSHYIVPGLSELPAQPTEEPPDVFPELRMGDPQSEHRPHASLYDTAGQPQTSDGVNRLESLEDVVEQFQEDQEL